MKLVILALVLGVILLVEANNISHKQKTIAKYGVEIQGPGHKLIRVKKARTQVVEGTMHMMKVVVERQMIGAPSGPSDCNLEVWEKPDGCLKVNSFTCE